MSNKALPLDLHCLATRCGLTCVSGSPLRWRCGLGHEWAAAAAALAGGDWCPACDALCRASPDFLATRIEAMAEGALKAVRLGSAWNSHAGGPLVALVRCRLGHSHPVLLRALFARWAREQTTPCATCDAVDLRRPRALLAGEIRRATGLLEDVAGVVAGYLHGGQALLYFGGASAAETAYMLGWLHDEGPVAWARCAPAVRRGAAVLRALEEEENSWGRLGDLLRCGPTALPTYHSDVRQFLAYRVWVRAPALLPDICSNPTSCFDGRHLRRQWQIDLTVQRAVKNHQLPEYMAKMVETIVRLRRLRQDPDLFHVGGSGALSPAQLLGVAAAVVPALSNAGRAQLWVVFLDWCRRKGIAPLEN